MRKDGITSRGFKALIATQFLGAFNDNAFKFVIVMLATDGYVGSQRAATFVALAGAALVLPFILFSTYAGFLADRMSKRRIIIATKILELAIMAGGFFALASGQIWWMLAVIFFMGTQSALFSPSKYGILPEILEEDELSMGNGMVQLWTNAAIILGTAAGGTLLYITKPRVELSALVFIAVSLAGVASSFYVSRVEASGSKRPVQIFFLKEIFENVAALRRDRAIFLSILGLVYFGFLGALFQLNISLYARELMGLNEQVTGILLVVLVLGIGAGAFLAGKLSDKKIEFGLVPLGAIGLSIFTMLLGYCSGSVVQVGICLFLLGMCAGFYVVPLNAYIQYKSPPAERGQILATNNFLSFSAMLIGCGAVALLNDHLPLNPAQVFIVIGFITLAGAVYITALLPYALLRFLVWVMTHTLYRIRVAGAEHVPETGGALLTPNHVSYVDALPMVVSIQRPIRFVVYRDIYNLPVLRGLLKLARAIPIDGHDNPKALARSLKEARTALQNGELVCVFPEGQLTRTGNTLKFNQGLEWIMKGVDCPVIPVNLDRIWGSVFSYERGRYFFKVPKMFPYPLTISFGEALPPTVKAATVRSHVTELGADAFGYRLEEKYTLAEAFWHEARKHPLRFCVADPARRLNFAQTLTAAAALAGRLRGEIGNEGYVGLLLPPSVPGALANIAVGMCGKVPVNLNYTASPEAFASAIEQCGIKKIITARKFLEKISIEATDRHIFIEDILERMTATDRLKAALKAFAVPAALSRRWIFGPATERPGIRNLATVMFTSGSTGEPKGVMLTHANITANLEGLYQVFHTQRQDKLLGVLPFFHSFGFTATLWFPLISGIGAVYHANPLDAKMIGKLVADERATLMMATPTFLNAYIRRCTAEQFSSLRIVVVGAEKLRSQIAEAFEEKFGVTPMEGYGCTELSPIVALNLPDFDANGVRQRSNKTGSIGQPLPGVAARIADRDSGAILPPGEEGLLLIKGANVMKGYLNRPEATDKVMRDGWYVTGDIARMDDEGFIVITDRLSRFSKIGGEMVPHVRVESMIQDILQTTDPVCAVTAVPDERKGEKLVVLHTVELDAGAVVRQLQDRGLPNLWIPDAGMFFPVDVIPMLGSGKLDLGAIKRKANVLCPDPK